MCFSALVPKESPVSAVLLVRGFRHGKIHRIKDTGFVLRFFFKVSVGKRIIIFQNILKCFLPTVNHA